MTGLLPLGTLPVAALYLHIWLTILDGGWTGLRRITWLLLGLSWFGAVAAGFLGYVLPWGQLSFWLAAQMSALPIIGSSIIEWAFRHSGNAVLAGAAGLLTILPFAADVVVATVLRLRGRPIWSAVIILATGAGLAVLLWLGRTPGPAAPVSSDNSLTPVGIVPRWYMLPWYAILRGPADKLLGVALMALAALLPLGAPWMRTERFCSGAAGIVWPLLCIALLADFCGLGWLGAQPPEGSVIVASRVLTAGWFAFFLLAVPLMRRIVRHDGYASRI
ncbi:hypothetical protein MKK64_17130 [Methylobacterium sp. E-025]|uniref:cytochrome b N-terminal domain-containing protein n=1 Tax=Methylobacterium sp. E-025 TaxID=2836561 RepID=UPI001FB95ACE|nr:cytochrome b N-terminal domain-containing protein [Methylobacterium sp. E-025]MCJ2112908.1 hypothetical protein [Methylobacterium sp. E-025]